jgi:hypothetical protein
MTGFIWPGGTQRPVLEASISDATPANVSARQWFVQGFMPLTLSMAPRTNSRL